ncbi:MAG: glycoside hydrolase family 18 protein [Planctomycetes bacterium]|nr:glycoside hydrolase family 18 protein [Planctomycetota bacterium]
MRLARSACTLLAWTALAGLLAPLPAQSAPKEIVGYYTSWSIYRRNYQVGEIPASMLTRLNYAFANVVDGRAVLGDPIADLQNFAKLTTLRLAHPNLKILLSVGGWTWSSGFSDAVLTPMARQVFASSCVDLMVAHGFDGVDIDWEYPVSGGLPTNITRPADKGNFTLFMAELRRQLDLEGIRQNRTFLLTTTAPASPTIIDNLEVAKIHPYVDTISLMAYALHGPWNPGFDLTGFSSALYPDPRSLFAEPARSLFNVAAAVKAYLDAEVPRQKLHLGVMFQGIGFAGVSATASGLYGLYTGPATGTWGPVYFDYTDLEQNYVGKNGYQRYWHDAARVPWLYNPTAAVMITYDDPRSIREKAWFTKTAGLGGAMFWELSGDRNKALLGALHAELANVVALRAPVRELSLAAPARIDLLVESDAARAGRFYYVVGSLTGTAPGLSLPGGVLPIAFDQLTWMSIVSANSPLFPNTIGMLDAAGSARAGFNAVVLGPLPSVLAGMKLHFAAWVAQSSANLTGEPSNPVDVFFVR